MVTQATNNCYYLVMHSTSNPLFARMRQKRINAASAVLNGTSDVLWVTGGKDVRGKSLRSTEFVSFGRSSPGPLLPLPLVGHCVLVINDWTVMVIGKCHVMWVSCHVSSYHMGAHVIS